MRISFRGQVYHNRAVCGAKGKGFSPRFESAGRLANPSIPAILDRPSRFDRKHYLQLPAEAERVAYMAAWHKDLQPELRLSEAARVELVRQTEGFSFAYPKELFLSSMMQWMANAGGSSMDDLMPGQAAQLRAQMTNRESPAATSTGQ